MESAPKTRAGTALSLAPRPSPHPSPLPFSLSSPHVFQITFDTQPPHNPQKRKELLVFYLRKHDI